MKFIADIVTLNLHNETLSRYSNVVNFETDHNMRLVDLSSSTAFSFKKRGNKRIRTSVGFKLSTISTTFYTPSV